MNRLLYFPRWLFPNNLGDSCVFAIIPKLIKELWPKDTIEVVTYGSLIPLLERSKHVDVVREPTPKELLRPISFIQAAFHENTRNEKHQVIYPENHPKLFSTIRDNFDKFVTHDSLNFILLNYLLQLGLVDEFINQKQFNIFELDSEVKRVSSEFNIAVCPMTKTNGKSTAHPGCNGKGFRLNGDKGLESWKELAYGIKDGTGSGIYEFSPSHLGIGDYHVGHKDSMLDLYLESLEIDYVLTTDGGYHHLFNLSRTPLSLFTGTKVTKPEFMQLGNAFVPDVHLECRKTCSSFYSEVFGVEDKSSTCNLECERVDIKKLTRLCQEDINHVRSNRIRRR